MKRFPRRSILWVMLFTCTFFNYMIRVNMSILIVAMVKPEENATKIKPACANRKTSSIFQLESTGESRLPNYGERYSWTSDMQGQVLASFFWGLIITSIPGGFLAEKFGAKTVVRVSTLGSIVCTHLTPLVASWNFYALIIVRFLFGLLAGVVYPSLHWLISRWVVPGEKSIFVSALLGASLGITFTWPFLGVIVTNIGWKWAFHITGFIILIWWVFWEVFVTNIPATNRFLPDWEKEYLMSNLEGVSSVKRKLPCKRILMSLPFWAYIIFHFGNLYGIFFMMTSAALFISTVLGYNLQNTGIIIAIPYVIRVIIGILFALLGDYLIRKNIMGKTVVRKVFTIFSHFLPGLCLIVMMFTDCDVNWALVMSIVIVGISGASTITNFQNNQDLSPNFTSTLYGIANCIACTSGFISPAVVGAFTRKRNGLEEWHFVFLLTAGVFFVSATFFLIWGTAEIQPWNEPETQT